MLASTLAQRAEFFCLELFERPVTPRRGRILVQMALGDLERTLGRKAYELEILGNGFRTWE